jgi:hypothetical protein
MARAARCCSVGSVVGVDAGRAKRAPPPRRGRPREAGGRERGYAVGTGGSPAAACFFAVRGAHRRSDPDDGHAVLAGMLRRAPGFRFSYPCSSWAARSRRVGAARRLTFARGFRNEGAQGRVHDHGLVDPAAEQAGEELAPTPSPVAACHLSLPLSGSWTSGTSSSRHDVRFLVRVLWHFQSVQTSLRRARHGRCGLPEPALANATFGAGWSSGEP